MPKLPSRMNNNRNNNHNNKNTRGIFFLIMVGVLRLLGLLGLWAFLGLGPSSQAKPKDSSESDLVSQRASIRAGHELSDANSKRLMWFGIALFFGAIVMHSSLSALFFALRRSYVELNPPKNVEPSLLREREKPPQPRLQINSRADLKAYFDRESHLLSTYGWVDKNSDIARIPIERAMDLLASHSHSGFPAQDYSRDYSRAYSKKLGLPPKTITRGSND